jgi:3-methyladenine DNA glycosylase AlkD
VQRRRVVYGSGVAADVELIEAVRAALRGAAQPELARPMQAYMKSATPFLGVRVPVMRTLTRAAAKLRPFTAAADVMDTALRLWRKAGYREERYAAIESAIGESDFFLRKAIGWALRDHARTDPAWVRSFAGTRDLSPLSRREALKHLS